MANREPGRRVPPSRWGHLSKNLALWILILVVPVFLFQLMSRGSRQVQELTFTDFVRQVESGNVLRVTIIDGRRVDGELKTELPSARPGGRPVNRFRTLLPARDDPTVIKFLQDNGVVIAAGEARTPWLAYVANVLPYVLIIALWILFMRQMQAGGARAFSFGKSKAKLLSGETPKVTFADVAGCDEAKEELQEIIEFLKEPSKFGRLGGRLPKGALVVGPPGTGKTLLAKAVAGEAARPFFSMSGSDFVEMFVGVGAARVRDLFEQGKAHA
ncbi:MAG: ATP-dependent metallopeptidase FtsH/Yme1/Tma family protein, partial [Gemmatimonadetes bacterium]|nr:ATP-dependent metallopeptidase FtsH/Yme1/Tma family protein [Gemmatimonadota bacterium]